MESVSLNDQISLQFLRLQSRKSRESIISTYGWEELNSRSSNFTLESEMNGARELAFPRTSLTIFDFSFEEGYLEIMSLAISRRKWCFWIQRWRFWRFEIIGLICRISKFSFSMRASSNIWSKCDLEIKGRKSINESSLWQNGHRFSSIS